MNKFKFFIVFLLFQQMNTIAQVLISNKTEVVKTVNQNALLQLETMDNNKGLLLPRVELISVNNPSPLTAHVAGIVIFNTATTGATAFDVTPGMYFNDGNRWNKMTINIPRVGDTKSGFQSADHNGWYLLDGRAVNTLSSTASANALALNLGSSIPNATDRFLKSVNGESVNTLGGADDFSIARANLPNINFNATISSAGAHTHTYTDNITTAKNVASGTNNPVANNTNANGTTDAAGNHTHTVSIPSGGSGTAVQYKPDFIVTNTFIYLGK
jgi:hypothetical protein